MAAPDPVPIKLSRSPQREGSGEGPRQRQASTYEAGEIVLREGDPGSHLYFVIAGHARAEQAGQAGSGASDQATSSASWP